MKHFFKLLLTANLLPLTVAAQQSDITFTEVNTPEEFAAALERLDPGIRLMSDFETVGDTGMMIDSDLVLDLNGHTLTCNKALCPRNNINFTVDDYSEGEQGSLIQGETSNLILKAVPGTVTINRGHLIGYDYGIKPVLSIERGGELVINGGLFTLGEHFHSYVISNESHTVINGGTIVGRDGFWAPVLTASNGVTDVYGGAIYAGNRTGAKAFETSIYEDENWESEAGTLNLPEGVIDGGAVVLDEKWAIPGTRYINYIIPEVAMVGATHYYTPGGETFALPVPDTYQEMPFVGWSRTADDKTNLLTEITPDMDENLQLHGVWRYTWIDDNVQTDFVPLSVSPAEGEVESLHTIVLNCESEIAIHDDMTHEALLTNALTGALVATGTLSNDWDEPNSVFITLSDEVTDGGNYRLFIKGGAFGDADYYYSEYEEGRCNPNLTYNYTIKRKPSTGADTVETDPADGSTVTSLHVIRISYPDESNVMSNYNDEPLQLFDQTGNIVAEISSEEVGNDPEQGNTMICTLPEEITAEGVYTLFVPAAFFAFDWWERECSEQRFSWTVVANPASVGQIANESEFDVYTLTGVRVIHAKQLSDTDTLAPGIYIANGKKLIIR